MSKKILVLQFKHETNAFCPAPASMTAFKNATFLVGDECFTENRGRGTEMGGVLKALEPHSDFELIPTVALTATPSGPVTEEVFDFVAASVTGKLAECGKVDGIVIIFHGAMVAEGHLDAEGDLLEMIRGIVGWEVPIMASLDLHANVTEKMAKCATALVPYECYPHTDDHETSYVAAQLLAETLDGELKPVMAYRRIPFLLPLFPTACPEFSPLYELARELQARPGARCVRFTHGFYASDIDEMGMCVMAITNGDKDLAESIADELAAAIDKEKGNLREKYPALDEALDRAMEPGERPYVIADTSDNPGGGGLGDTTHILRRVLERGITGGAFAIIVDPAFVQLCEKSGVGTTVEGDLGGWSDPAFSGGPLHVTAYVRAITHGMFRNKGKMSQGALAKCGKTAIVEIGGNVIVVASFPKQPFDLEVYRSNGIEPLDYKFLVVKSAIHFRAHYGTVAREMVAVPLPGYIAPTPEHFPYRHWKGSV